MSDHELRDKIAKKLYVERLMHEMSQSELAEKIGTRKSSAFSSSMGWRVSSAMNRCPSAPIHQSKAVPMLSAHFLAMVLFTR